MNRRELSVAAAFTVLVCSAGPFAPLAAQSTATRSPQLVWENDRIRVERILLAPGERLVGESRGGRVVVFLTADLDGRMPAAEAVWHEAGPVTMENRGPARFEALVVDLKSRTPRASGVTPPETLPAPGIAQWGRYRDTYGRMIVESKNVVENEYVSVTKQRYAPASSEYFNPIHFHPQDVVVIYLRGGYAWPATGHYGPHVLPDAVRRGDVRIVPANTIHLDGNAGSDPLELLLIITP